MISRRNKGLLTLLLSINLTLASPVLAETKIEIDSQDAFNDQELSSGAIKVLVNYRPYNFEQGDSSENNNLQYRIFYDGVEQINKKTFTVFTGGVSLQDLDTNGIPEVIVETYSGGAHCCTNFKIYTWRNNQFIEQDTGFLDGSGGEFSDLDEDGKIEFVTSDNSFLYKFSSYAASFPPSLVLSFRNGELQDTTRQHPKELRSRAWQMYQSFLEAKKGNYPVNGFLAGYVAQKILLGEYQQGWDFMLAHYDKTSDWGLDEIQDGERVPKYPDFPTALRAFLIEQGYL